MKIIARPSTNFSERNPKSKVNSIVLHYTGMKSAEEALDRMCDDNYQVSAHYCIDYDGDIYQLVDEDKKAWHAGKSWWRGIDDLNQTSIGIEIVNKGHEFGYENFSEEQINSVLHLCKDIKSRWPIDDKFVVGHSDIAPDRKEDPGEFFPWKELSIKGLGIWPNELGESIFSKYDNYMFTTSDIIKTKKDLDKIGYYVHPSDIMDKQFKDVLAAFYRRFLPERILMQKDKRYPKNIHLDGFAIEVISKVAKAYK